MGVYKAAFTSYFKYLEEIIELPDTKMVSLLSQHYIATYKCAKIHDIVHTLRTANFALGKVEMRMQRGAVVAGRHQ